MFMLMNRPKLIGVPPMDDATGKAQATAAIYLSKKWPVDKSLVSVGLDTTTSNTGLRQGSVIRIEQELYKSVCYGWPAAITCTSYILNTHLPNCLAREVDPMTCFSSLFSQFGLI